MIRTLKTKGRIVFIKIVKHKNKKVTSTRKQLKYEMAVSTLERETQCLLMSVQRKER